MIRRDDDEMMTMMMSRVLEESATPFSVDDKYPGRAPKCYE